MSSPETDAAAHFGRVAGSYDELRPVDASWWEVFDAIVRAGDLRGRRVLDLGCGTGRLAAALSERAVARVWGVDASAEMAAVAAASGVHAKVARAELLPFKSGWFERAVSRMAVHLFDRPRAFAELRRVLAPDGVAVVATLDPGQFAASWLLPWFPSVNALDASRFPSSDELERELTDAGFAASVARLAQRGRISRDDALRKIRGRAYSTFDLLPDDELREGVARAEREFPESVEYERIWLIATASVSPGRR